MAETKKTRKTTSPVRRWLVRAGLATLLGLVIGGAGGVFTVQKFEPGRGTGVDSLQIMLDSIAKGRIAARPVSDAAPASQRRVDAPTATEAPPAEAPELVAVPAVIDLEEGTARNAILDAGLQVGEVQFQASTKPAGTVLATLPVAGAQVPALTAVSLVLSDGRAPAGEDDTTDSLPRFPLLPTR